MLLFTNTTLWSAVPDGGVFGQHPKASVWYEKYVRCILLVRSADYSIDSIIASVLEVPYVGTSTVIGYSGGTYESGCLDPESAVLRPYVDRRQ